MSDTEEPVVDDAQVQEEENKAREEAAAEATAAVAAEQAEQVAAAEAAQAAEEAAQEAQRAAAAEAAAAAAEEERQARIAEEEANLAASKAAEEAAAAEATAAANAAVEQARKEAADTKAPASPSKATKAIKQAVSTGEPLQDALGRLTDNKTGINYVMVTVEGKRGTKLKVSDEGTGGFAEMLGKLDQKKVYFIGIKVKAVDERSVESVRTKYVVATYIGPKAPMMKKAGASTVKAKLTQAWGGISIYYSAPDLEDFTTTDLAQRLLQCGGAHKPSYYDFGDGTRFDLNFYAEHAGGGR